MKIIPFLTLLVASASLASAALTRTATNSFGSLSINGAVCPEVTGWSGGDIAGTVTQSSSGGTAKKHISSVSYDPIVVESALPLSIPLAECLTNFLAGKGAPQTLTLSTSDASGKTDSTLQASGAILEEVQFPKLDGSSKDALRVTFIFRADNVKPGAPEAAASRGQKRVSALASNFRLSIDGLPTNRVASIDAFSIKGTSNAKLASAKADRPTPSDLTLSISQADLADWAAWRDSFLVQGNNQDTAEKSGTLEFLAPDMKSVLFTVQFSHLGLIRLSMPPSDSETVARVQAELYAETASLPPAPSSPPKAVLNAPGDLNPAPAKRVLVKP